MRFHFVSSNTYFPYYFYLAAKSVLCTQKNPEITIWTYNPPDNEYWRSLLDDERITFKDVDEKQLPHFKGYGGRWRAPYVADLVGYMKLYEYGGIYLDFDIFALRDITYLLKKDVFVIRQFLKQTKIEHFVIMAKPQSKTIKLALDYSLAKVEEGGGDPGWGETGPVAMEWAVQNSDEEIDICEDLRMFMEFYWGDPRPFEEKPNVELPQNAHLMHLWSHALDTETTPLLRKFTPEYVESSKSLYARLVRKIIPKADLGSGL